MKSNLFNILIIIISVVLVAVLGTVFTGLGMTWYQSLLKPSQWVPSFVFPIVWTLIYGLSIFLLIVWQKNEVLDNKTIILFAINGFLNVLWCLVFFTLHAILLGNIVIILNLIFAFYLFNHLQKNNKPLSILLAIYPFWLCLATTLNTAIWILN